MENVWKASKTIILFLIIVIAIQTVFGDKTAQKMTVFILFSMLILQSETVATYLSKITSNLTNFESTKTTETETPHQSSTHTSTSNNTHGGAGHTF